MQTDPLLQTIAVGQSLEVLSGYGFRFGDKGTHTSRTIMLQELATLLDATPPHALRPAFDEAVIDHNCLGKATLSSRHLSAQRLRELYALDPGVTLFRLFRQFWHMDERSRPLLALLTALARDPILRLTAAAILELQPGEELSRQKLFKSLAETLQSRLNEATIDKVLRNAASSWTQSGHLTGRMRKIRANVQPDPIALTYALLLGWLCGVRGEALLTTFWTDVLDLNVTRLRELAIDAKRMGLLDMNQAGGVMIISFNTLLTDEERQIAHGTH